MPRKRKTEVKVNNTSSLEELMQETYNDACLQIMDAQRAINELTTGTNPEDVGDTTKVFKEKAGLFKIKDSAIRIKLELAKLQSDIIKNNGDLEATLLEKNNASASLDEFKSIREIIKKNAIDNKLNDEEDSIF